MNKSGKFLLKTHAFALQTSARGPYLYVNKPVEHLLCKLCNARGMEKCSTIKNYWDTTSLKVSWYSFYMTIFHFKRISPVRFKGLQGFFFNSLELPTWPGIEIWPELVKVWFIFNWVRRKRWNFSSLKCHVCAACAHESLITMQSQFLYSSFKRQKLSTLV